MGSLPFLAVLPFLTEGSPQVKMRVVDGVTQNLSVLRCPPTATTMNILEKFTCMAPQSMSECLDENEVIAGVREINSQVLALCLLS